MWSSDVFRLPVRSRRIATLTSGCRKFQLAGRGAHLPAVPHALRCAKRVAAGQLRILIAGLLFLVLPRGYKHGAPMRLGLYCVGRVRVVARGARDGALSPRAVIRVRCTCAPGPQLARSQVDTESSSTCVANSCYSAQV